MKKSSKITEIDQHFANEMLLKRKINNITQQQMSELLKVSIQQVQKYENGRNRITIGKLYNISKILNISIDKFFNHTNDQHHKIQNLIGDAELLELVQYYNQLPDTFRANILQFIKNHVKSYQNATITQDNTPSYKDTGS